MTKQTEHPKNMPFVDRLAHQLPKGAVEDLLPFAQTEGLDAATFTQHFQQARSLLKSGPDPRQVSALPTPFQQAFLRLAEQKDDSEQITDLLALTKDKEVQKEARRSLHRLRSRGQRVEEPASQGPSILDRRVLPEEPPLPCYLSAIDGEGNTIVFLARYVHGGVAVYQATIHDQDGLADFAGGVIGRNRYRGMIKQMLDQANNEFLQIEYAEARNHVSRAASRSREHAKPLPEGYLEASSSLPESDQPVATPDAQTLFPKESFVLDPQLLSQAGDLHDSPFFETWHPDAETLKIISDKLEEVRNSKLAINDQQKLEQVKKVIDEGAKIMLEDPQRRQRSQERLLQAAVFLHRIGQPDMAKQAAHSAWHLSSNDFKPEENLFFDRLIKKLFKNPEEILKHILANQSGKNADEHAHDHEHDHEPPENDPGKLIVTP